MIDNGGDPDLHAVITHAESLLPEEKQMVIDAYNQGHVDGDSIAWCYKNQDGEQYFNETFVKSWTSWKKDTTKNGMN